MMKDRNKHSHAPPAATKDAGRAERLAAALRSNLKRRKDQARARTAQVDEPDQPANNTAQRDSAINQDHPHGRDGED